MRRDLRHPDISGIFSTLSTYRRWLAIEQAAASAGGFDDTAWMIGELDIDGEFVRLVEAVDAPTRVAAFVMALESELERRFIEDDIRENARFVHFGLSEQNVIDTDLAIACQKVTEVIHGGARQLIHSLDNTVDTLRGVTRMGYDTFREVYPVPTAQFVRAFRDEIVRTSNRLQSAADEIPGSFAGPMGDHPFIDPMELAPVMSRLGRGLDWDASTTRIVQRDRLVVWVQSMMNYAASLEKLARWLADEQIRCQVEADTQTLSLVADSAVKARMYARDVVDVSTQSNGEMINRVEAEFIPLLSDRTALASLDMRQLVPDLTFVARGAHSTHPSAFHEMHRRIMATPDLSRRTQEARIEEERR